MTLISQCGILKHRAHSRAEAKWGQCIASAPSQFSWEGKNKRSLGFALTPIGTERCGQPQGMALPNSFCRCFALRSCRSRILSTAKKGGSRALPTRLPRRTADALVWLVLRYRPLQTKPPTREICVAANVWSWGSLNISIATFCRWLSCTATLNAETRELFSQSSLTRRWAQFVL